MKNIISIGWNNWLKRHKESILLFDSVAAASEIALMLNGQWDGEQCDFVRRPQKSALAKKYSQYSKIFITALAVLTLEK